MKKTKKFISIQGMKNVIGLGIIDIKDNNVTYAWFTGDVMADPVTTEVLYNSNNEPYFIDKDGDKWLINEFTRV